MIRSNAPPYPSAATLVPARESVDPRFTWDLSAIFTDWPAWEDAFRDLDAGIDDFHAFEGTLARGRSSCSASLRERTRSASSPT